MPCNDESLTRSESAMDPGSTGGSWSAEVGCTVGSGKTSEVVGAGLGVTVGVPEVSLLPASGVGVGVAVAVKSASGMDSS